MNLLEGVMSTGGMLLLVLTITLSNLLMIVAIALMKQLHNTHDYIVLALAVSDLMCGFRGSINIFNILADTSGTYTPLDWTTSTWYCQLNYATIILTFQTSLSFLLLVCIERSLAVNLPQWHRKHVTNTTIIVPIVVIYLKGVAWAVYAGVRVAQSISESTMCDMVSTGPLKDLYVMDAVHLYVHLVSCAALSVQIILASARRKRQRRKLSDATRSSGSTRSSVDRDARRQKKIEKEKLATHKATVPLLMALFVVLYLPVSIFLALELAEVTVDNRDFVMPLVFFPAFFNAAVKTGVYSVMRPVYGFVFRYLVRTAPWKWGEVQRAYYNSIPFIFTRARYKRQDRKTTASTF